jgi:hypothetical protein
MNQWVKIKKNGDAPKYREYVFVALKNGTVCTAQYENFIFVDVKNSKLKNVTHWMKYLPTHPDHLNKI